MTAGAFSIDDKQRESIGARLLKLALVLGLHAALAACLLRAQIDAPTEPVPVRIDARTIVLPAPKPQEAPKPVAPPPKAPVQPPKPVPQAAARPAVRPAAPVRQPPVLAAAPAAEQAPPSIAAAPQPSAPAKEEATPASAPVAVADARFDADYLQNPAPVYPPLSRKSGEEGKVLLLVQVSAQGTAEDVQIRQSSGFLRLDQAAVNAVRKWRFVPARRGTEAVTGSVVVPLVFRLDS